MIHEGTDLKFRVTASLEGFDLSEDDFAITIRNRFGMVVADIGKEQMFYDEQGRWYFVLEHVSRGIYYASFCAVRPDEDFDDDTQHVVDVQYLCSVGMCDCERRPSCACGGTDGMAVAYERIWTVNVDDGLYLADMYGNPILTSEGEKIRLARNEGEVRRDTRLSMTGEEFKKLVEGRDANGRIDTVPEVLDALAGVDDDMEVAITTDTDIDNMMSRILGNKTEGGNEQ